MHQFLRSIAISLAFFLGGCASSEAPASPEPDPTDAGIECRITCPTPPGDCRYDGAMAAGDCDDITCGRLVCPDRAPE